MHRDWLVEGVLVTAIGVAVAILSLLAVRSDWYQHRVIQSVLSTYRRPITPTAVRRRVPYVKTVLYVGIALGLVITILGIATFIKGL